MTAPTLICPNCSKPLPEYTLRAAAGVLSQRGKAGRKRSDAPRCPCGTMTAKRAAARGHRCEPVGGAPTTSTGLS